MRRSTPDIKFLYCQAKNKCFERKVPLVLTVLIIKNFVTISEKCWLLYRAQSTSCSWESITYLPLYVKSILRFIKIFTEIFSGLHPASVEYIRHPTFHISQVVFIMYDTLLSKLVSSSIFLPKSWKLFFCLSFVCILPLFA